jgi:hypothetical protein
MFAARISSWCALLLTATLVGTGCQKSAPQAAPETTSVDLDQVTYRISGPYSGDNLSVYLIQSDDQDPREFMTLEQGFKEGLVKVTEKDQAQVHELQVDNQSDYPLFLQEGDRLEGGKQDRTIVASLVIPPHSGKMAVPTFCIEAGRWVAGSRGTSFRATGNYAYAPKAIRCAAKINKDQGQVWKSVAVHKDAAAKAVSAGNRNTSLNEMLDSPEIQKITDQLTAALDGVQDGPDDTVGVAIVLNGKIEEVNIYPNHQVFQRLYPRLLQSYALQAFLEKADAKDDPPQSAARIAQFITEGKEKSRRSEKIDGMNHVEFRELENEDEARVVLCQTTYDGQIVHRQLVTKHKTSAQPVGMNPMGAAACRTREW